MKVSISCDPYKERALKLLPEIKSWLEKKGCEVVSREKKPDVEITFGGDGNTFRVVSACSKIGVPVLSINAGRVGFLTSGDINDWKTPLKQLLAGPCYIEKRLGLKLQYKGKEYGPLANDVYYRCTRGVAQFSVVINGISTYGEMIADGFIVSTQTGSTGYNQGASGPICLPGVEDLLVTPICPAVVNSRSLVVPPKSKIVISVTACRKPNTVILFIDGQELDEVSGPSEILVKAHETRLLFVSLGDSNFFHALQTKKGLKC